MNKIEKDYYLVKLIIILYIRVVIDINKLAQKKVQWGRAKTCIAEEGRDFEKA